MSESEAIPTIVIPPLGKRLTAMDRACSRCEYTAIEGKDRVCRFEPPKLSMFMVPMMKAPLPGLGQQPGFSVVTQTGFPVVRDDQWCGKYITRRP